MTKSPGENFLEVWGWDGENHRVSPPDLHLRPVTEGTDEFGRLPGQFEPIDPEDADYYKTQAPDSQRGTDEF